MLKLAEEEAASRSVPRPTTRRRAERLSLEECPVEGRILGWFAFRRACAGVLVDISETGLGLRLDRPVAIGAPLHVRVRIPFLVETIEGDVVVRWRCQEGDGFRVGAEFTAMPAGETIKIQCLRRLMKSPEWRQRLATRRRAVREANAPPAHEIEIIKNPNA